VTYVVDLEVRCELISKPGAVLTLRSVGGDFTIDDLTIAITRLEELDG
jgi:hypothetical protein